MDMSVEYPLAPGTTVAVKDRDDVGEIVDGGKNLGQVYCVGVLFPSGAVVYYEHKSVTPAT